MRPSLLPLFLGVLVACKPDIPDPIWRGDFLHYGTTTSAPVCRGSFFRQEQHAVELAQMLGFELPEVIRFTRISQPEVPEYCSGIEFASGCAWVDDPYTFSTRSYHFHELAHVVANLGGLDGPPPFKEGFAEVFSDGAEPTVLGVPLVQVLHDFASDSRDYHTAARFVRFLIERHDLDRFTEFLRSTPRSAGFDAFAPIFAEVFGEPLEVAMGDFEDYPNCSDMTNRIAVVDCNLALEPWDDTVITLSANVTCGQDDVLGPDTDDVMFTTRGFEIEQPGSYIVSASEPPGWSQFRLIKCGSCWDLVDEAITPGAVESHDFTPGRYYALFGRRVDEPAELSLVVERL